MAAAPAFRERKPELVTKPISFSLLEDYDKGENLRDVEAGFRLMNELGISTWRGSFGCDDYEPAPVVYNFDFLHRFARLAARHHIYLRPYVGYTPQWAAKPGGQDNEVWNNPPRHIDEWQCGKLRAMIRCCLAG